MADKNKKKTNDDPYALSIELCQKNNLNMPCQQQHTIISRYSHEKGAAIIRKYKTDAPHIMIPGMICGSNEDVSFIDHSCMHLLEKVKKDPPKFMCVNDTKCDDPDRKKVFYEKVEKLFEYLYSEKPFYEK